MNTGNLHYYNISYLYTSNYLNLLSQTKDFLHLIILVSHTNTQSWGKSSYNIPRWCIWTTNETALYFKVFLWWRWL